MGCAEANMANSERCGIKPGAFALVDRIRAIVFDRSLDDRDIARGIRDALREHAGEDFGDND
jgi:hypothetical protein